jgi:hypothetical protein
MPFSLAGLQAWTPAAQRLLFRGVRLYAAERVPQFLYATAPDSLVPSTRRLGHWVRSLDYQMGTSESKALFPYVLRHCPNLRELKLTIMGTLDVRTHCIASTQQDFVARFTSPYLIRQYTAAMPCRLPNEYSQCLIWRPVNHCATIPSPVEWNPPSRRPRDRTWAHLWAQAQIEPNWDIPEELKLYELQILTSYWDQYQSRILHKILQHSVGTLRILDLVCIELPPNFSELLTLHGPHLRSLRLPNFGRMKCSQRSSNACSGGNRVSLISTQSNS